MWPTPQEIADLVTFTEEILNGKLHFLCSACFFLSAEISESFGWEYFTLIMCKALEHWLVNDIFSSETFLKSWIEFNFFTILLEYFFSQKTLRNISCACPQPISLKICSHFAGSIISGITPLTLLFHRLMNP